MSSFVHEQTLKSHRAAQQTFRSQVSNYFWSPKLWALCVKRPLSPTPFFLYWKMCNCLNIYSLDRVCILETICSAALFPTLWVVCCFVFTMHLKFVFSYLHYTSVKMRVWFMAVIPSHKHLEKIRPENIWHSWVITISYWTSVSPFYWTADKQTV